MIRAVAEVTNFTFEDIYNISASDFFFYIAYLNERARRQEIQQKKEEARLRAMRRK